MNECSYVLEWEYLSVSVINGRNNEVYVADEVRTNTMMVNELFVYLPKLRCVLCEKVLLAVDLSRR